MYLLYMDIVFQYKEIIFIYRWVVLEELWSPLTSEKRIRFNYLVLEVILERYKEQTIYGEVRVKRWRDRVGW